MSTAEEAAAELDGESIHQWSTDRWCVYTGGLLAKLALARNQDVQTRTEIAELEDRLARALPVVEAAGALVDEWYYRPQEGSEAADSNEAHFEVLEAAVLAAREPRTGEGR